MCILIGKRPVIAIIAFNQFAKYKFFLQFKSCETYTLFPWLYNVLAKLETSCSLHISKLILLLQAITCCMPNVKRRHLDHCIKFSCKHKRRTKTSAY